MELLTDTNPNEELLKLISLKEAECLTQIHTRFCLLNARRFDLADIEHRVFENRPNYWEYYWMRGKMVYFLMSRELVIENGEPKLNIKFNKDLLKED